VKPPGFSSRRFHKGDVILYQKSEDGSPLPFLDRHGKPKAVHQAIPGLVHITSRARVGSFLPCHLWRVPGLGVGRRFPIPLIITMSGSASRYHLRMGNPGNRARLKDVSREDSVFGRQAMRRQAMPILLGILLGACGPSAASPGTIPQSTLSPSPASAQNTVVTGPGRDRPGGALISYQRSGGFAGISEEWTIYADGRVVSPQGQEYHVPPEQVLRLVDEIVALAFFDIQVPDSRFSTCRDCFTYQISVSDSQRVRALTFVDGAADTPPELRQVASLIEDFLSGVQSR